MEALILSCSTGGGHNAAGRAVKEVLDARGHSATMMDPYILAGGNLDRMVGNGYIKIAQKTPRLFGAVYKLGDEYRKLPIHSPVYSINRVMIGKMRAYLEKCKCDVILVPHVFPGVILANMRERGMPLPKVIFIATDYVCIPFTEETECDYYVTPAEELSEDFTKRGIPSEKLLSAGIPVSRAFNEQIGRDEAVSALNLDRDRRYLLLAGGSIGAGMIGQTIEALGPFMRKNPEYSLIVICGNNGRLFEKLKEEHGQNPWIILLSRTDRMALYMKACDAFLTKPGGLSSTEAAVSGTPMIHLSPIPGCENRNMDFFAKHGMSIAIGNRLDLLPSALRSVCDPAFAERMIKNQRAHINPNAASDIVDFAERIVG